MIRIQLNFFEQFDLELFEKGILYKLIRLRATVRLKTEKGWTPAMIAIIDTGSPFSIIPPSIWRKIYFKNLLKDEMPLYGFGSNEHSPIFGQLVETEILFIDKNNFSPTIFIRPYLLTREVSPLILGFEDFLTKTTLISDYPNNSAYLEFYP